MNKFIFTFFIFLLSLNLYARSPDNSPAMPIFVEPPLPQALANILFKPRYRTIEGQSVKEPDMFGMMINFEYDSTRILPESLPLLDSVGEMLTLERVKNEALIIEGHTDAKGTDVYNYDLSERRAQAIKDYLTASFAIEPERMLIIGRGEEELYDGSDPLNPLNRRAVFKPLKNISIN